MPVTVILEQHRPRPHPPIEHAKTRDEFLARSCPYEYDPQGKTHVRASSFFSDPKEDRNHYPSSSSVVRSAIEAWARHSHLVLRPDDIWFQILVQMNFFMSRNGESLRESFISHEGKEEIEVIDDDWYTIVARFDDEIQKRVKTPWLAAWINPGFSTSGPHDSLTAIVLMMGLMSTFFEYSADIVCGIPSITLLGTKEDWNRLLAKIERLKDFGWEPENYQRRLRPILSRIVKTFDDPSSTETKDFWDQMVHAKVRHNGICGKPPIQYMISGWILGLFYWDRFGSESFARGVRSESDCMILMYDEVCYGEAALETLPVGYARVPVRSPRKEGQADEDRWAGWILAGSIGKKITEGAPTGYWKDARSPTKGRVPRVTENKKRKSRFSRCMRSLGCSVGSESADEDHDELRSRPSGEKNHKTTAADMRRQSRHSTIQPRSGWFIFGPQMELAPMEDDAETRGPTVDAIESCEGPERYGPAFDTPEKAWTPPSSRPYELPPIDKMLEVRGVRQLIAK